MKTFIELFDYQFLQLHTSSCELIEKVPDEKLYRQLKESESSFSTNSCGENILLSAGKVEQTFGGITAKLWDDPFEWTLPEELSSGDKILDYLAEVEETRQTGFALFQQDEDLRRELPAPEKLKTIFEILIETLACAGHFQGRAFAIFQTFSDEKLPKI